MPFDGRPGLTMENRMTCFTRTALFVGASVAAFGHLSGAAAGQPAAGIITRAPAVTSKGGNSGQIGIRCTSKYRDSGGLSWSAFYRAPDDFALRIDGSNDHEPLIFFRDDQLLVYNAAEGTALCAAGLKFDFVLRYAEGFLKHRFAVEPAERRGGAQSTLVLDLPSLFPSGSDRTTRTPSERGEFRLTRTTDGGQRFVALINPRLRCPFRWIAYYGKRSSEPDFTIHEISVGEDAIDDLPAFPPRDRLAGKVEVEDAAQRGEIQANIPVFIAMAMDGRVAVKHAHERAEYERRYGAKIDWDRAVLRDRAISESLREILAVGGRAGKGDQGRRQSGPKEKG